MDLEALNKQVAPHLRVIDITSIVDDIVDERRHISYHPKAVMLVRFP